MGKTGYLASQEQVKQALRLDSLRDLSQDRIVEFTSLIPKMDKDVARSIIGQFPSYAQMAKDMVGQLGALCERAMEHADASRRDAVAAYMKTLDTISRELERDDLSEAERLSINDRLVLVADKVADLDAKNKQFLEGIAKIGPAVVCLALALGAAVLGVNVKGKGLAGKALRK